MLRVKVCGMCDPLNVTEIAEAKPDFMGFIFFQGSQRYVGDNVPFIMCLPELNEQGFLLMKIIKRLLNYQSERVLI